MPSRLLLATCLAGVVAAGEAIHLEVQTGHAAEFNSLACSPDGRLIATSAADQTVRLWDIASGLQVRTLVGHAYREVSGVGFSLDGSSLYSTSDGAMVHRVADGAIEAACNDPEYCLGALPGGGRLVQLRRTAGLAGIGLRRGEITTVLAEVPAAEVEKSAWVEGTDIYWLWSGTTRVLRVLRAQEAQAAFRPAGPAVALPTGATVESVWPSPDLRWLALVLKGGQQPRRLLVCALADGSTVLEAALPPMSKAYSEEVVFVPGRQEVLLNRGADWQPTHGGQPGVTALAWPGGARRIYSATPRGSEAMACTPDGRLLATADWDGVLRLWELASGTLLREARSSATPADLAVVAAPDGRRWALQDQRRKAAPWRILDLASGRIEVEVPDAAGVPAFSADGAWFMPGAQAAPARLDPGAAPATAWVRPAVWPAGVTLRSDPAKSLLVVARDGREQTFPVTVPAGPAEVATKDRTQALKEPVRESGSADGRLATLSGWGASGDWVGVIDLAAGRAWHRPSGHHLIENLLIDAARGRLLYGTYEGFIGVRDLADGRELARFPAHAGAVAYASEVDSSNSGLIDPDTHAYGLQLTAGGRWLLSVGDDGVVRCWDAADHRLLATLAASVDGDYILALPDGRYFATPGGAALVAVVEGGRATSLDQRDLALNRPDEVLATLGHARPETVALYRAAVERRWRQHGLADAPGAAAVVMAELATALPESTAEATLSVAVRARAEAGLDRLVVTCNGVPVGGAAGTPVSGAAAERSITVPLTHGLNRIQVSARDRRGGESLRLQRLVTRTGEAAPATLHVVAIGVSDYVDPAWRLAYAAADARAIAGRLGRSGGFATRRIEAVLDREATRERIAALREALARSQPQDTVVLFIAGHGLLDDAGSYWFATADTDFAAPSQRALSFAELEGLLDGIPAQRKLLLMDTCHSGEADGSAPPLALAAGVKARGSGVRGLRRAGVASAPLARLTRELFTDLRGGSGTVVIASAGGDEYAFESDDWKGGVFTRTLLDGLDGAADEDRDGRVQLGELRRWLPRTVAARTGGQQRPMVRQDSALIAFALGGPAVDTPATAR